MNAPLRLQKKTCRVRGSPKRKAPLTAYVYCDYCATCTDWARPLSPLRR